MPKDLNIKKVSLQNSLRFTLLVWFLLLALVPASIISYKSYESSVINLKEAAVHELAQSSILKKAFINNWFSYRKIDISSWSQSAFTVNYLKQLTNAYESSNTNIETFINTDIYRNLIEANENDIVTLSRQYDYVYDIYLIDTKGNILYSVSKEKDLGENLIDGVYNATSFASAYKKTLQDNTIHFSDLEHYQPSNNKVAGFLTSPLKGDNGEIIGVFAVQIKLNKILSLFDNLEKNMIGFSHYLVGSDGLLRSDISHKEKVMDFKINTKQFVLWQEEHSLYEGEFGDHDEVTLTYKNSFGEDVYGLHQNISIMGVQWVLISEVTQKSVFEATKDLARTNLIFLSITILIIFMAAIFVTRRITKPLQLLAEASIGYSKGRRDIVVKVDSKNELGQLASAFNIMIDALKSNEIELKNQTMQVREALTQLDEQKFALNAHSIVAITDVKGDITFVNDKFEDISGFSREELIGKNHRILASGVHSRDFWKAMYAKVSKGEIWNAEVCNLTKNGEPYWVNTTIVPFMNAQNKPKSYIAIRTDITEQKEVEEELIKSNNIAQESVKTKAEFLASMSHEIRTPMNGVIGMLGLLLNTKLDDTQKQQAHLAQSSANALLTLINDILDFSKVEAGKLELEAIEFNVRDLIGDFAHSLAFKAQEKGVELILDLVDVERTLISADSGRIRQILNNIVGNAIKFTSDGYILIKVQLYRDVAKNMRLKIDVIDTGIGIAKDKISGLFDSFTQVDASTTRKYGGTGLGLAIVKNLTELMDGSIEVTSEPGEGSKFSIDIAVKSVKHSSLVMPKSSLEGKKVLIVDSCLMNTKVLQKQLEHWGAKVETLRGVDGALEVGKFDIAFVNITFKDLAKELKKHTINKNAKLILMTNMSSYGNKEMLNSLGFDENISKPITTKDIFKSFNILFGNKLDENAYVSEELTFDWPKNTRLLLVEDNRTNQLVANGILASFGLNADVANDGNEAIKAIKDSSISQPYSVVLMDCQMPDMDGYEASAAIRDGLAGKENTKLPIIAMTANAMQGDKQKCIAAGMDDYISKPLDPLALQHILKKWILQSTEKLTSDETKGEQELDAWDELDALNRLGGSNELLLKILTLFLEEIKENALKLQEAMKRGDMKAVTTLAHTIKGSAGNLSAYKVQKIAKLIELDLEHRYDILQESIDEVVIIFKEYIQTHTTLHDNVNTFERDEFLLGIETLAKELQGGSFVDTNSLNLFDVSVNDLVDQRLQELKVEVDNFNTDKALVIIEHIKSMLEGNL